MSARMRSFKCSGAAVVTLQTAKGGNEERAVRSGTGSDVLLERTNAVRTASAARALRSLELLFIQLRLAP
jgi:hypothetical protein